MVSFLLRVWHWTWGPTSEENINISKGIPRKKSWPLPHTLGRKPHTSKKRIGEGAAKGVCAWGYAPVQEGPKVTKASPGAFLHMRRVCASLCAGPDHPRGFWPPCLGSLWGFSLGPSGLPLGLHTAGFRMRGVIKNTRSLFSGSCAQSFPKGILPSKYQYSCRHPDKLVHGPFKIPVFAKGILTNIGQKTIIKRKILFYKGMRRGYAPYIYMGSWLASST